MYTAVTRGIEVNVVPTFILERSDPDEGVYFWAYRVVIFNDGDQAVQIVSRYWQIIDANGKVKEVSGAGVVGEQPVLGKGDSYEYSSGCPLATESGIMQGHYCAKTESGETFNVLIPAFSLDLPDYSPTFN